MLVEKLDNIRVTYSGLLSFVVAIGGIFAGLAFVIIVTRQLSPEEFGVWAIIGSMASYSIATEPLISYWTTRQVARGVPVAKTTIVSTSMFVVGSIPVYLLSIYLFTNIEPAFFDSMLLGTILIPVLFLQGTISAINFGHQPHAVSVGLTAFQAVKIPTGLALVYFLGLGLDGAILAIFAAHLAEIAIQLRYARPRLAVSLNLTYLRGWIRQSWIPLYSRIPGIMSAFDIILYTIIVGSVIGAAYFTAALVVTKLVSRAGQVSQALYPKLLAKGSLDYIPENFVLMMYFAIPLLVLAILFSQHVMFLLNPEYAAAWVAGALLAVAMFIHMITNFIRNVLRGLDDVDLVENPAFSTLLRSRLFLVSTIENIYYASYLSILAVSLYIMRDLPEPQLVAVWSLVMLGISIPFLIYHIILIRKYATFQIPLANILKQVVGSIGVVILFVLTDSYIVVRETSIYAYLPGLLLELIICCLVYLGITYAIDPKTRKLFKLVISEMTTHHRK